MLKMVVDLNTRNHQSELMDDPSLDDAAHRQALQGLRRINRWSRADAAVWKVIREFGAQSTTAKPLTILDIASGGGDLAIRLATLAQRDHISLKIDGCDISPTAIEFAREQAAAAKFANITFHQCNALEQAFPQAKYDIVMCSLFLHHLTQEHSVRLLERMHAAANRLVLIDDLRRTKFGYWLAWLGCRVLTRCSVVHVDGPMSVEGAFTTQEAQSIAARAGLIGATIRPHWPQRFLLTWRPEDGGRE
jgi:2-polyprenyl-3-methyl-5-hydroxy-6-metoxy-1,4-benzoquinol methylase